MPPNILNYESLAPETKLRDMHGSTILAWTFYFISSNILLPRNPASRASKAVNHFMTKKSKFSRI